LQINEGHADAWSLAQGLPGPVVILGGPPQTASDTDVATIPAPQHDENPLTIWSDILGHQEAQALAAPEVAETFNLSPTCARRAARTVQFGLAPDLWQAAQTQAGDDIGALAQKLDRLCNWDDLVLPKGQSEALEQMAQFLMNRHKVNAGWGFGRKSPRGLGMAALFYGDSGTGKTSAAEALVGRMHDQQGAPISLYRVNTSALVSKYIGETSKNFAQVFEAGRASGAALLFDEAEGLFGKRSSQNRDSHDKHANAELGFLLQCLETYPGIAILTTNMRQAIDTAFFRRFRFAIEFPFPDRADRKAIWQRVVPDELPCAQLDFDGLSVLPLSGGSIRSVMVNAAFVAAGDGTDRVGMAHIKQAVRLEFAKLEKALPERIIAGLAE
jgi:AAA+ superfamily predicted ATPase